MKPPSISIIMPTYKDALLLEKAIASVCAQRYEDWELLVIDDGLTEAARRRLENIVTSDQRIRSIVNERNLGVQQSLNRGLASARGEFIARIDDDDEWTEKDKLGVQLLFLTKNQNYVLVGTNAIIADEQGRTLGTYALPETDDAIRRRMLMKNCFLHPTVMIRKSAIEQVGGYPEGESTKHIEDYVLWLILGTYGKFANLHMCAARLTVHVSSMTAQNRILQTKRMRNIIFRYRHEYPHFFISFLILSIRHLGFLFTAIVPIPKVLLYHIQKIYKSI